jgi:hypothetical protein
MTQLAFARFRKLIPPAADIDKVALGRIIRLSGERGRQIVSRIERLEEGQQRLKTRENAIRAGDTVSFLSDAAL